MLRYPNTRTKVELSFGFHYFTEMSDLSKYRRIKERPEQFGEQTIILVEKPATYKRE